MERGDRNIDKETIDTVTQAYRELFSPWIKKGMPLPNTSVLEVSRITELPPQAVLEAITSGGIVLNGSIAPQQASLVVASTRLGKFSKRTAASIWSEGQRYQRRPQFAITEKVGQSAGSDRAGRPTSKRIRSRVLKEMVRRKKIEFKPLKPEYEKTAANKNELTAQVWQARAERKQDRIDNPLFAFLEQQTQFPIQNGPSLKDKIKALTSLGLPVNIGCFVCLPGEWVNIKGEPKYRIDTSGKTLSRLEQPEFTRRTRLLLEGLENTGTDFRWKFLIADTDANEVFGPWLAPGQNIEKAIQEFQARAISAFNDLMPGKVETVLWSSYQSEKQADYESAAKSALTPEEVLKAVSERYLARIDYYRSLLTTQGFKVTPEMLDIFAREIPTRNTILYAAQGPLVDYNFDLLVVGDPDPLRLAKYQSILARRLNIWFPYRG